MDFVRSGNSGKIVYQILSDDKVEDALEVQQISMRDENVAIGVGIYEDDNQGEDLKCVFREVVKDNCTIVGIDGDTDEVVAVSFNKLHTKSQGDEPNFLGQVVENHVKAPAALALIQFLDEVESKVDIFKKYKIEAAMEIFYIGTHPNYRGRRIGKEILGASIALGTELKNQYGGKIKPEAAFGVFTSNYSQKLAEGHDFEWLSTVLYSDYEFLGKKMADRITNKEHKTSKFGARLL